MEKTLKFVSEHMEDDVTRLILDRKRWPEIDMDLAVSCIESRRKLKGKVPEWYGKEGLVFPVKLSAEQCSSSATGAYKARVAEMIAGCPSDGADDRTGCSTSKDGWVLADLTGGLGVDSWYFSKKASQVIYNEMQSALCDAARHNFKLLGADNVVVVNNEAAAGRCGDMLVRQDITERRTPDIVYLDPARRGEGGKKVFLIEDCTPDILTLKDEIFRYSRHILVKLSPMADITMACGRLGNTCREVHVVASGGECKELLIWMDREWKGEYKVKAVELPSDYPEDKESTFIFYPSEEESARMLLSEDIADPGLPKRPVWLFEPGKSLMKAGAFKLIAERSGLQKLGASTHYYVTEIEETAKSLSGLGKIYKVVEILALNNRNIKDTGKRYPKAEVTARNIPLDTDALRKKLGTASGGEVHIFGLKADKSGNILLICLRQK